MIKIDEDDPVGEVEPSFPYRDVQIQRGVDIKDYYDLQEEIGRGKFGTVYKCREKSTGLQLAAKFVSTSRKEDKRNVEREIDIMRNLQHPRLIQLYDAFEKDRTTIVILELSLTNFLFQCLSYQNLVAPVKNQTSGLSPVQGCVYTKIQGGELFERVIDDDFVLTERSCTVFMRQICEGMEFIHKQNILHLDMKPENILCLTKTGNRIKIIDFGLARKYDPDKKLQVLFGTPEFVAPEVVNFDRIGFGTDMWSIGVICYVLLSGLSPFMGETDIETMANVTISKWDFDDDAFLEISDDAKDFISNLLVKDKEKRLTATQCLAHPWLRRKPLVSTTTQQTLALPQQSDLDLAKDNLKFFVERWNEHPNSPYLFDTSYQTISPCVSFNNVKGRRSRTPSSSGCSPSPCGSISSLVDSNYLDSPPKSPKPSLIPVDMNNTPCASPKSYYLERLQHFDRRASDSSCFMRSSTDIASRINLAEEIKKLSDKLLKINRLQLKQNNGGDTDDLSCQAEFESNLLHVSDNNCTTENFNKGYYYSSTTVKSTSYYTSAHRSSIDLGAPKRKFKFSNTNRDVPLPVIHTSKHNERVLQHEEPSHMLSNSPDLTSNLLHLLDKYENEKCFSRGMDSIHRKSLSVEWSELESLGQRTMKSLTSFIETSRNTQQSGNKIITSKVD